MASRIDDSRIARGSGEFVEASILDTLIISSSEAELRSQLESWDGATPESSQSILPFASHRGFLLFDEQVPVFVVLRTPYIPQARLKSYLSRLSIVLEAYATGNAPVPVSASIESQQAPTSVVQKEVLYSHGVENLDAPWACAPPQAEDGDIKGWHHSYVVWKVDSFLGRPRTRYTRPSIYFTASASLRASAPTMPIQDNEYMPSFVPSSINLLQPFENDPSIHGPRPRITAQRMAKIAPAPSLARELVRSIQYRGRRRYRAAPAFIWRMRYSTWRNAAIEPAFIASLDIEVNSFAGCDVSFDKIGVSSPSNKVESVSGTDVCDSTSIHKPGDQITLIYKIQTNTREHPNHAQNHLIDIVLDATVHTTEDYKPHIVSQWRTNFEPPSTHATAPKHQDIRVQSPDSLPTSEPNLDQNAQQSDGMGISLSVTGPPRSAIGETVRWDVFIVNRSDKSRRIALLVMPKRRRTQNVRPSSSSTMGGGKHDANNIDVADAITDDYIVHAMQRNAVSEPEDLVCLSTDVRIGPLSPSACYETKLDFLPFATGALQVEAVRVVDLDTHEAVDIRDLPTIIAVEGIS